MKKHILAVSIALALASNAFSAKMPERLIIFGDSLSDNGNILRFTLNQENVYNEYLANYFGYSSPRHDGNMFTKRNQDGPNYALGGAVANPNFSGMQGWLSPKLGDEVQNYLKSGRVIQDRDNKYVFWIGGNDLRLADDAIKLDDPKQSIDQSNNPQILESVKYVETYLRRLLTDARAKFLIVPNAPNIANTPNFTNNFLADGGIYYKGYKKLAGCNGSGWNCFWGVAPKVGKDELIRLLDDQKNQGKSVKEVIYGVFEYAVRKHHKLSNSQQLTQDAQNELNLWKQQFERVFAAETSLVNAFNSGVDKVIDKFKNHQDYQDVTFIRPNIQLLLDEVIEHYQDFGFNNVSGSAANPFTTAVIGTGAGKGRVAAFEPRDGIAGVRDKKYLWNKGYKYVFADQFHPSPKTHRMIYDYIVSLLESERGDPTDMSVQRVSTTPFTSTANKIYHSAEDDGVFNTLDAGNITKDHLDIYNDGRALFATDGKTIHLTNSNITSQGRLGGIINAEQQGKIYLDHGNINIYRTNPYVAPFGVMVNGNGSVVELNHINLNTYGKETTAITVGNLAVIKLTDSNITTNGVGANVLNLWDSRAELKNTTLKTESENASGVRVFANDNAYYESGLNMENSTITATNHYAIKIAENVTKSRVSLQATLKNSTINGAIYTADNHKNSLLNAKSNFTFEQNSHWNMNKNSNVTNAKFTDSVLNLSQSATDWQAKTLSIADQLSMQNSSIYLGTDLGADNSETDKIVVKGESALNAQLYIEKRRSSTGAATQAGIKVIDLNPAKNNSGTLSLAKELTAGVYQYMLTHGGVGADDQSDWYLTSTYTRKDNEVVPVVTVDQDNPDQQAQDSAGKNRNPRSINDPRPTEEIKPAEPAVQPAEEVKPAEPAPQPAEEVKPVEPAPQPAEEIKPAEPTVQPAEEIKPAEPTVQPAEEVKPAEPAPQPAEEVKPAEPTVQPAEEVKPAEPAPQPAEEVKPVEPAPQPAEEVKPAEPTVQPAEEVKPAEPTVQPAEEIKPAEPTVQPAEEVKPAEPAPQPAEEVKPAEPTVQPAEEVKPAEPAPQPAEEVKPAEPTVQPAEEVKPAEPAPQPAEEVKPVEPAPQPAEEVKPAEPTVQPAEEVKPAEPAAETETVNTEEQAHEDETQSSTESQAATTNVETPMEVKPILNKDATLLSALPYVSQYLADLHLDYARRNPHAPLWDRQNALDYWINLSYVYNRAKGDEFLRIKQNSQILALGKDVVSTTNTLAGVSATYSKTQSSVDNYVNCQLGLRCYAGKITSEMASINGYYLYNLDNWYAQAVISVGRVIHKFKNADKQNYKQNGYIVSAEQLIGYRYPLQTNWTLYADIGLQESYHRYSSVVVDEIKVDDVDNSNVNAMMNLGMQYRVDNFALSSNLRLVKNVHDFDRVTMNNTVIQDNFAKDSAAISGNVRYYFTDNVSLFMNAEYLRSLNQHNKVHQFNYQAGLKIQF